MSEEKLQSDIVVKFSQLYPEKRGQLFHPSNERNSTQQAFRAKAIGIVSGVADLILFDRKIGNVATELKLPESRHVVNHITQQLQWGKVWESQGGTWRLCRTVEEAMDCYNGGLVSGLTIMEVERMIENNGDKITIKF